MQLLEKSTCRMIKLNDKKDCCGCSACQQICPRKCINMEEDPEGFLYPKVDSALCINCHKCERVCPVINRYSSANKPLSYGAKTYNEELRQKSSSGGIFTEIATRIIEMGGVVFGARFLDDWTVVHGFTDSLDGLSMFRGSKYVQSKMGDSYTNVKKFLDEGRIVLFTGTPCQVSGLNHFLGKKHNNLYTIDMVCHSVPSPKVWRLYLEDIKNNASITHITFRDKETFGWKNYGLNIEANTLEGPTILAKGGHLGMDANIYMRGFLSNLTTRPSCYSCPARNYTSGSDLMIADFWHLDKYHPDWDDNKGMSVVLAVTEMGKNLFDEIKNSIFCYPIPYEEVEEKGIHLPITESTKPHIYRKKFFENIKDERITKQLYYYLHKNDVRVKTVNFLKSIGRCFGLDSILRICKITKE